MKAFQANIKGRVQGVGFRYSTLAKANSLGLSGWVRNEPDGSVSVECEGDGLKVEELKKWLKKGPQGAYVSDIRINDIAYQGYYRRFSIEH